MSTSPADAAELHRRAIVIDGHCDTPYRLLRHNLHLDDHDAEAQLDIRTMREGGITASFFAAYVPPFYAKREPAKFAFRLIDIIHEEVKRRPDELVFAASSDEIVAAKKANKLALMIGVEGGHAIEDSLDILRELYARGSRYMTLTHVNTNNWCDSSGDAPRHNGLTEFGREVVATMNDIGMVVDISHVSDAAFAHAIEATRVPIVATHSSCRAICRHPRNMTDDMLRTLANNGGVCMINFFSAFISDEVAQVIMNSSKRSKKPEGAGANEELPDDNADWSSYLEWFRSLDIPAATLEQVADHVLHAVNVAGADHVGIGSDFDGVPSLPQGLEGAASLPRLTERLVARGLPSSDVEKVLGGNFLRVFRDVEGGRR